MDRLGQSVSLGEDQSVGRLLRSRQIRLENQIDQSCPVARLDQTEIRLGLAEEEPRRLRVDDEEGTTVTRP